ncbi:MAG: dihydrofolate reductase family protein [Acidobacteria bacterium]|nr:dihydrofolate reductase family protein [Acidobacteriota bacterium]
MAKLIYFMPSSLDGYIAGDGNFDWSPPSEEVFSFMTELIRPMGTYLYGRKEYETMAVWATPEVLPGLTPPMQDFARIWQAAEKIVYSQTWQSISAPNTRLERIFDPALVREWKAQAPLDLSIAGPTLAAQAIEAGLVDEYQLFIMPALLGGGIPVLSAKVRRKLELLDERRFANGTIYLHYRSPD